MAKGRRMIFVLEDGQAEALEALRVRTGARSWAEVLRSLIDEAVRRKGGVAASGGSGRGGTVEITIGEGGVATVEPKSPEPPAPKVPGLSVPLAGTFVRKPMQKGGKK